MLELERSRLRARKYQDAATVRTSDAEKKLELGSVHTTILQVLQHYCLSYSHVRLSSTCRCKTNKCSPIYPDIRNIALLVSMDIYLKLSINTKIPGIRYLEFRGVYF